MNTSREPDVIVVGGGIGGLSAAFALARQGLRVRVLERARQFGEVGAGMQIAPNCTRILQEYGLLGEAKRLGVRPGNMIMRDALDGRELTRLVVLTARTWGALWHLDGTRRLRRNAILRARDTYDYSFTDWIYGPTALTPEQEPALYHAIPLDSVPLDSVPLDSVPLDSVPLDSVPLDSVPPAQGPARRDGRLEC